MELNTSMPFFKQSVTACKSEAESQLYVTHRTPEASVRRRWASCLLRVFSCSGRENSAKRERRESRLLRREVNRHYGDSANNFAEIPSNIAEHVASFVAIEAPLGANYEGTGGEGS